MNTSISVAWSDIKAFIDQRKVAFQWISLSGRYHICAYDGGFSLFCMLMQDGSAATDITDFETNYKVNGNKSPIQSMPILSTPAFASKTFGTKNLYKRVVGQQFPLIAGNNTLLYIEQFPWVKFMALEIINGEVGDYVSLYILDTATGTYSGFPNATLNQFGFSANVGAGFYSHKSEFDADLYQGLQVKIVYTSKSIKTIGINYVMNELK